MAEQQSKLGYVAIATALITSVPALVTSIAAFRRPADTAPAKAVYEQLAKDVRELSDQNRRNHEDLVAMRNYLDGYLRGTRKPRVRPDKDGDGIPEADAGAPTPKATGKGSGGGTRTRSSCRRRPLRRRGSAQRRLRSRLPASKTCSDLHRTIHGPPRSSEAVQQGFGAAPRHFLFLPQD